MVDILEDMVLSDFLYGNRPQTYQRYIRMAKNLLQCPNILSFIENIDGKKLGSRTLDISLLEDGTLFSSWREEEPYLVRTASENVRKSMEHNPVHAPSFYKSRKNLLRELHCLCQYRNITQSPSFPHSSEQPLPQPRLDKRAWNKCFPIQCTAMRMTLATN